MASSCENLPSTSESVAMPTGYGVRVEEQAARPHGPRTSKGNPESDPCRRAVGVLFLQAEQF